MKTIENIDHRKITIFLLKSEIAKFRIFKKACFEAYPFFTCPDVNLPE